MSDLMREEFEAWWSSTPILGENKRTIAEKAWQSSRECMVIDTRPIRIEADCHVEAGVESVFYAAIDAIHAAGVKTK